MSEKILQIAYSEYTDFESLPLKDRELARRAQASQALSYAPYSSFRVGAAVELEDGQILGNGNQENAAYSLCLCAERSVIAAVKSLHPSLKIKSIAVTASADQQLVSPCGACRQVMHETEIAQGSPIHVILQGNKGTWLTFSAAKDILPFPFGPENLKN